MEVRINTHEKLENFDKHCLSFRHVELPYLFEQFHQVYEEDPRLALKWTFYARDIKHGLGERKLFKSLMEYLSIHPKKRVDHLLNYIPYYGRWDDIIKLIEAPLLTHECIKLIKRQFETDLISFTLGNPISLLAKWLPSINTSSKETVRLAKIIIKELNMSEREYRQTLSMLRKHLDIVERKMSLNQWELINYEKVPEGAYHRYHKSFVKHDRENFILASYKRYVEGNKNRPHTLACSLEDDLPRMNLIDKLNSIRYRDIEFKITTSALSIDLDSKLYK